MPAARRAWRRLFVPAVLALAGANAMSSAPQPGGKVSMAVMGDSNSSSYQDRVTLPLPDQRGGAYRSRTFQWGEVIARLRPGEVDPGPWETSGVSNPRLRWLDVLGIPVLRAPRKEDYRFNFAIDGADCNQLMGTRFRQAPRLVALMDKEPERWKQGVVVIRIGLANLTPVLDIQAQTPGAPAVQAAIQTCLKAYGDAVALIRSRHPETRIVLVSVFDDSNDPDNLQRWQSARESNNIARMFESFEKGLRDIAARYPHISFFDDRAWFRHHWGSRDENGKPDYRTLSVGGLKLGLTVGDAPSNAILGDSHNGLVWNVLWAQDLVQHLHDVASLPVKPISDQEVEGFVRSLTDAP